MRKFMYFVMLLMICVFAAACGGGSNEAVEAVLDGGFEYIHVEPEETPAAEAPQEEVLEIPPEEEPSRRTPFEILPALLRNYSADAEEAIAFVEGVHPNFIVAGRMCMETYEAFREEYLYATANPMTRAEFILATQRFLTVFNDGHLSRTFLTGEWYWNAREREWEWETGLVQNGDFIDRYFLSRNGRLFLADENLVITSTEVLAIGGVTVDEIFAVIDRYYGAYNYAGRQRARGRYSRYQVMLLRAGASLYRDEDGNLVTDLTVLKDGEEYIMEVGFTDVHPTSYRSPDFVPEYRVRWEMKNDDVLYIALRGGIPSVNEYVYGAVEAIEQAMADGVRKFILDVRNFAGGVVAVGHALFDAMGVTPPGHGLLINLDGWYWEQQYHWPFPPASLEFLNFSPEDLARNYIYVPRNPGQAANPYGVFIAALTGERTFSAATKIAVEVADSGFGIVIGEPSSTAPTGYGAGRSIWLYNSRIQMRPHYYFFLRPDETADQITLWPDIHVYEWDALEAALEFFAGM